MEVRTVLDVKAIKAEWEDAEFFKSGMSADEIALGVRKCRIAYDGNMRGLCNVDRLRAISLLLDPPAELAFHQGGHNLLVLPHEVALQDAACSGGGACGR